MLKIGTLFFASFLSIIGGAALHSVYCAEPRPESEAERYVLEQVRNGLSARLADKFPETEFPEDEFPDKRTLRASFVESLLTSTSQQTSGENGQIVIENATIKGEIILRNREILPSVYFHECTFDNNVAFENTHFAKGLGFTLSTFEGFFELSGASIDVDFEATYCRFSGFANFDYLRIGRNAMVVGSIFDTSVVSFERGRVGGSLFLDDSHFLSKSVSFTGLRVDGTFSAKRCLFAPAQAPADVNSVYVEGSEELESKVSFSAAHSVDFFLNDSVFESISVIDFTRMETDFLSLDRVSTKTPTKVDLQRLVFKSISPVDVGQLGFFLSKFNPEFYSNLEASLRAHGYPNEADKIFIYKKRAERQEKCKDFMRQCELTTWAWSYFQDKLAGYGKSLQNLLVWSVGFLIIGMLVFRNEKGMRPKDWNEVAHLAGKYHAFWYSLDLFLPIIKLGEADVWTPKDNRRWASLYRKVHIIIGSFFVPIGLAAWTGIIK